MNQPAHVKAQLKTPYKLQAPKAGKQIRPFTKLFLENPEIANKFQGNFKTKTGSNELFNFYQLPVDKMVCAVPNRKIKLHLKVYRPELLPGEVAGNMPNAVPNLSLQQDDDVPIK